jgi:hypothetical protein
MGLGAKFLHRTVKNEAMKAELPEIYGWRVFMLACSACFGSMPFGIGYWNHRRCADAARNHRVLPTLPRILHN